MFWGLGAFFASIINSPIASLIWWKVAYSSVIFIPVFFLHFVCLLTSKYNRLLLFFSYFQGIVFLILTSNGNMFSSAKFMFNSFYYCQGGIIYIISFFIWMFLISISHYILIKFYFTNKQSEYGFLLAASICGFSGGVSNFLPALSIDIYPAGNFIIPVYVPILVYAILRYKILEINIVFQKSFVYSVLIALITSTYFIFVLLAEKLFQGMVGYTSLVVSVIYAFVIALFFNPVKNKIQHLADKIFLGKDPIQIAKENELMKQELERAERLKAVAHFASGMAHEIKNPLTAIKTFAEYLPEKKNDPEFLNKFSKIVSGEVGRIDSLVHQLLDFAKPVPLNLQKINIHSLLDDTLSLLNNDFIKHNIKLVKEYQAQNSQLKADSNKLKQAFLNLFLNSIDAMPNGGVLTVSTSIEHRGSSIADSVLISISDTGRGIPDKDLPHIFEPFYSTKEQGTGLGLSIVYNIIKEHNGSVEVESKKNEGTKFVIELLRNENIIRSKK
jgi:signal transduction histidine kinase